MSNAAYHAKKSPPITDEPINFPRGLAWKRTVPFDLLTHLNIESLQTSIIQHRDIFPLALFAKNVIYE